MTLYSKRYFCSKKKRKSVLEVSLQDWLIHFRPQVFSFVFKKIQSDKCGAVKNYPRYIYILRLRRKAGKHKSKCSAQPWTMQKDLPRDFDNIKSRRKSIVLQHISENCIAFLGSSTKGFCNGDFLLEDILIRR
jgi:hypothetical protein